MVNRERPDRSSTRRRRAGVHARARMAPVLAVVLLGLGAAGCSTHNEAVSNACRVVRAGRAVAVADRGGIALNRIGLTPRGLKAQEACK